MSRFIQRNILVCLFGVTPLCGMATLKDAQDYAQALQKKGNTQRFDIKACKALLQEVVQQRENVGYVGRHLIKLTPYPETTFVVWGPLKGSFSSLVRTLTYVHELGIIANDLRLTSSASYLVFNGDVIKDPETSLETLLLVLSLMKVNPHKVLYLKGASEDELQWQNDGLKRALDLKALTQKDEKNQVKRLLSRFFDTLPLALYITGQNPQEGSIRISYFSRISREVDEVNCGRILTSNLINIPQICSLSSPQKGPALVKAVIKSEQRLMSYQQHPGLALVEPDKGSVTWSIFSGPTPTYLREYQFSMDAFALIKTGKSIEDALIALYNSDIRSGEPLQFRGSYHLLTGTERTSRYTPPQPVSLQSVQADLSSLYTRLESLLSEVSHLTELIEKKEKRRE